MSSLQSSPRLSSLAKRGILVLACAVLALAAISTGQEQEKKLNRSDLPAAVQKSVDAQIQGGTVRGFSKEEENDQTYYEAELTVNGHTKDITMDPTGAIVEIEEQVELNSLPAAVKEGLQAKAGKGKTVKVESLKKQDQLVAYEAKVVTDGKESEVQVGSDGKPLDHEE